MRRRGPSLTSTSPHENYRPRPRRPRHPALDESVLLGSRLHHHHQISDDGATTEEAPGRGRRRGQRRRDASGERGAQGLPAVEVLAGVATPLLHSVPAGDGLLLLLPTPPAVALFPMAQLLKSMASRRRSPISPRLGRLADEEEAMKSSEETNQFCVKENEERGGSHEFAWW